MSFIQQYLGKSNDQITYADIVSFFVSPQEESDKIEFKAYVAIGDQRDKENGVIRSVCAFLNSSGGLLIWGAPLGQNVTGKTEKIFTGALSPATISIEKDYFINRITDSITPAPNNISFLTASDGTNYVYLLDIEQSEYRPHQFKNVYYMRIDGQTKPAPHHYIEALFKRITFPKLKGFIKLDRLYHNNRFFFIEMTAIIFNLSRMQNEHEVFYRIIVGRGAIFASSLTSSSGRYHMDGHEMRSTQKDQTIYYNQPYRFTELLRIDPSEVLNSGGEFRVDLWFAGKSSPMVHSSYRVRPNFSMPEQRELKDALRIEHENLYSFDYSDTLGQSEEERICAVLGRQ